MNPRHPTSLSEHKKKKTCIHLLLSYPCFTTQTYCGQLLSFAVSLREGELQIHTWVLLFNNIPKKLITVADMEGRSWDADFWHLWNRRLLILLFVISQTNFCQFIHITVRRLTDNSGNQWQDVEVCVHRRCHSYRPTFQRPGNRGAGLTFKHGCVHFWTASNGKKLFTFVTLRS